jgi:hypothetical protein
MQPNMGMRRSHGGGATGTAGSSIHAEGGGRKGIVGTEAPRYERYLSMTALEMGKDR